jgi:hypothetical protein
MKIKISNCEEFYLDKGDKIIDYRYKYLYQNCEYRYHTIDSCNNIIFRRIQYKDQNMIFGIPLSIAHRPNLLMSFDVRNKLL